MVLLSASGLKKEFADRVLFSDVTFSVNEGEHVGLIGANGTGKTTLMRMIEGEGEPSGGQLHLSRDARISYMRQDALITRRWSLIDEVTSAMTEVTALEARIEELKARLGGEDAQEAAAKLITAMERFEALGGLTYKSRVRSALMGLGFSEADLERGIDSLSGGERTRVKLAQILLCGANLLLLDEPTNHLDMDSVKWLEEYLSAYTGAFIVISHDRYFLDRVTTRIIELKDGTSRTYAGNYSEYIKKRDAIDEAAANHYKNTMREIERIEGIIEQQKRWNRERNLRTAASKQKVVDKLKSTLVEPAREAESIRFSLTTDRRGGEEVIIVSGVKKAYNGKTVFENAGFLVKNGERVFIIGANGCGKSTLLNIITGREQSDGGAFSFGADIKCGYYDQTRADIDPSKSALDTIWELADMREAEVRSALAMFGFKGDDVFKLAGELSGGEAARLSLLKLMLSRANFLILDEPTNHLDIASREALEDALLSYVGTLLIVSHDRYLINRLADRLYYMDETGLTEYLGNYDFFLEKTAGQPVKEQAAVRKERGKSEYAQKKEEQAAARKRERDTARTTEAIERLESEIAVMERELEKCASDYERIMELTAQIEAKKGQVEELYARWEELI